MPQPLFFNQIKYVPSVEVAMHRALWSFVFLFIILFFLNEIKDFLTLFKSINKILILSITAILIAINWTGFIYSVSIEQVQDASLGYFLTPMISICLGYLFLNEKLNFKKIISVLLMFFACLILITIFGLPYLIFLSVNNSGYFNFSNSFTPTMLILTGAITIFPLFFFNLGLKHIPLGLSGVLFYIAPSFHFITSIYVLEENISPEKLLAFLIIWLGVVIFIYDAVKKN